MLGDINIAEPKAQVGFAGPRVIEIGSFNPNKENILNQNLTSIISDLKEGIS